MRYFKFSLLFLLVLISLCLLTKSVRSEEPKSLSAEIIDRYAEAQEKLLHAKVNYKTIRMQENAIENMRKATRLSLKASKLRAKAERLQNKADVLVNKANLAALSRGLYITNPLTPVMSPPPPEVTSQVVSSPVSPPVPGQPINVAIPRGEEVSYIMDSGDGTLTPPLLDNY
ncbi:MAG: hypothetical protein HYY52_02035 [Candidatus Melainabacteria bacterium]|nr:hypothetical protein [Candidatus Melainabacteria bacterium]